jgi:hypothetical protein
MIMKNTISKIILAVSMVALITTSCSKDKLAEIYPDPSKTSSASVERFFTGVLQSSMDYVRMEYWRLFVVEQPSMGHYTQVMGWTNGEKQYEIAIGPVSDRWNSYYSGVMVQFREFSRLFNELPEEEKPNYRIMQMAASIYFYDHTQQVVDIWGKVPWSEAGMLRTNNGDLVASKPKYDDGEAIYTTMLDDLKQMAEEFKTISPSQGYQNMFTTQDIYLNGDVQKWRKYCNSLRLRMLMRVSGVSAFQSRVQTEVGQILNSPSDYPLIETNDDNVIKQSVAGTYESSGLQSAFETWGVYDIAPKAMVEHMKANTDPRLQCIFEPGANADGEYIGLDPMLDATAQGDQLTAGIIARYNGVTFTRSKMYPGWICTAAETNFHKAEAYSKILGNDGAAKTAYEQGVRNSILFYYWINQQSLEGSATLETPGEDAIAAYLQSAGVKWDGTANKMKLIGEQEWLHTGISQMGHTWAEIRRLGYPELQFFVDNSSAQKQPVVKWVYPAAEKNLNGDNYAAVSSYDDPNQKVFWDVN